MAAEVAAPRYSIERYSIDDFETRSIRSTAPSYRSEAPSYHTTYTHNETVPPYTRHDPLVSSSSSRQNNNTQNQPRYGLPPIPATPSIGTPDLLAFRLPTWTTVSTPAARVIERRARGNTTTAALSRPGRSNSGTNLTSTPSSTSISTYNPASGTVNGRTGSSGGNNNSSPPPRWSSFSVENPSGLVENEPFRPLEDPQLVGARAAAGARDARLMRERDAILLREDERWDWFLAEMSTSDSRREQQREREQRGVVIERPSGSRGRFHRHRGEGRAGAVERGAEARSLLHAWRRHR